MQGRRRQIPPQLLFDDPDLPFRFHLVSNPYNSLMSVHYTSPLFRCAALRQWLAVPCINECSILDTIGRHSS